MARPKLSNEVRVELAAEMAEVMTEAIADERGITVWQEGTDGESESYTPDAQEIFNDCYDKTEAVVNKVFGEPSGRRR